MRPPFPGMDPWLEDPELWPDVHNSLIVAIRDVLSPLIRPRYFAGIESRMTVLSASDQDQVDQADVAIRTAETAMPERERGVAVVDRVEVEPFHVEIPMGENEIEEAYLTIRELPGRRLVTVVEVLSPTNKKARTPREDYLEKRRELLGSGVNLVEIDLLRSGKPMPPERSRHKSDYRIIIVRPGQSHNAHLYGFSYRTPIPTVPVPLLPGEPEPSLDLNTILHELYERAGYDLAIDYQQPPHPRLRKADQTWVESIISQTKGQNPHLRDEGDASS